MLYQPMSSPQITRMFGCGSVRNQLDAPVERAAAPACRCWRRARSRPMPSGTSRPTAHTALHQRRRDGLGTGTRQRPRSGADSPVASGVPGDFQAPGREVALITSAMSSTSACDCGWIVAWPTSKWRRRRGHSGAWRRAPAPGRPRGRTVCSSCSAGLDAHGRRGQSRACRQAERQCGGGDRASARGARRSLDGPRVAGRHRDTHWPAPSLARHCCSRCR